MEAPTLLRIPDKSIENKENVGKIPILINCSTKSCKLMEKPLYQVPQNYVSHPILLNTSHITHNKAPKLLNIKEILTQTNAHNKPKILQTKDRSIPTLIRLPNIHQKQKMQLIESPRPTNVEFPKQKPLKLPVLVDLRSFALPQSTKNDISDKHLDQTKDSYPMARHINSDSLQSKRKYIPVGKKQHSIESDSSHSSLHDQKQQYNKKIKDNREAELYEVITDLLIERKKQRHKKKRIKLFDIIDKIPVTSSSDEDELESDLELTKKHHRKSCQHSNCTANKQNFLTTGQVFLPTRKPDTPSQLPNPPKTLLQSVYPSHKKQQDSEFKPKTPCYLGQFNREDDPLSWLNVVRTARNETKTTQTEKSSSNSLFSKHQEIQTELTEMLEIPRSETFLPSQDIIDSNKKTKVFCERVRNEILEKLENKILVEDKRIQTVSHSHAQTELSFEDYNDRDHYTTVSNVENNKVNNKGNAIFHKETSQFTIDPHVYSTISFDTADGQQKQVKEFIDVVDIEYTDGLFTKENLTDTAPVRSKKSDENDGNDDHVTSKYETKSTAGLVSDMEVTESLKIISSSRQQHDGIIEDAVVEKEQYNVLAANQISPSKTFRRETRVSGQPADKSSLAENIQHFSCGVQALEELHQNLEKELKHSKLLFNTIVTLQDGFDETEVRKQAAEKIEESKSKFRLDNEHCDESPRTTYHDSYNDHNFDEKFNGDVMESYGSALVQLNDDHKKTGVTFEDFQNKTLEAESKYDEVDNDGTSSQFQFKNLNYETDVNIELTPRSILSNKVSVTPKSFLKDDNNYGSINRTLDSVKFSPEVNCVDSFLGEVMLHKEIEEIERRQIEQDDTLREEIRKRITKQPSAEEVKAKRENIEKDILQKWMKEKKQERHNQYLQELEEKRGSEFRPFLSKRTVTKKEIDQNTSIQQDLKRALLEENNKERIRRAERIAYDVMSPKKSKLEQGLSSGRKKFFNSRYEKSKNITPVRETRSSRMRKTALMKDVCKHMNRIGRSKPKPKSGHAHLKADVTPKPMRNTNFTKSNTNSYVKGVTHNYDSENSYNNIDPKGRVSTQSFGGRSSRRSVDADEFVTQKSYEKYQKKTAQLLRETLTDFHTKCFYGEDENKFIEQIERKKLQMTYKFPSEKLSSDMIQKQSNTSSLNSIWHQSEFNLDAKLLERDTSSTSNLLAEVDMALADDTSNSTYSQTIDWNEIDNILNE